MKEGAGSRDKMKHVKKQLLIRREDDIDGRVRLASDEERVLWVG